MSASPGENHVTLSLPARTDHLHLLRLNVAAIAGGSFGIDEVEDAKIAVEELGAAMLRVEGAESFLHVEVSSDAGVLTVTGRRALLGQQPPELGDFVPTILDAMVDRYSFDVVDDVLRFHFEKNASGR